MIIKYTESIYKRDTFTPSNAGTEDVPAYVLGFKTDGGVYLKPNGTKPLYKQIQANKVNCDLSSVLEHCIHENQLAVTSLSDVESAIADFTSFKSYADIFTGVKHLGQIWNEMPLEVREQFNSSKASFISSIADTDFSERLSNGYDNYYQAINMRLDSKSSLPTLESTPAPAPAPAPASTPEVSESSGSSINNLQGGTL